MTTKKRVLKDLDFSGDKSHIALVHKDQGGPASGADYKLVIKSRLDPEIVAKAAKIRVTMDICEFIERFFHIYGSDAMVLASLMGYEMDDEDEPQSYEDYIKEKVSAFEIFEEMEESEDPEEMMKSLSGDDYIKVLKSQALVEKAFRKQDRLAKKNPAGNTAKEEDTEVVKSNESVNSNAKVDPSGENTKDKKMDEIVSLQKALDDQKVELEKALAAVAAMEAEKKEQVLKSKIAQIAEVMKDQVQAEIVAKAALKLESEEDFTSFVQVIKSLHEQIEKSALFQEQGTTIDTEATQKVSESRVSELLKAQFAKK